MLFSSMRFDLSERSIPRSYGKEQAAKGPPFAAALRRSDLGLILHAGHIVNGNKSLGVFPVDKVHQLLIFALVHDGNDLVVLFQIVCTDGLVHGRTAVQVMEDELTQRLLFFGDDADAAFDAVIKDEMVQHDAVEVSTEDTQHHGLFIVDQGRGKRHTHSRQRHGFS